MPEDESFRRRAALEGELQEKAWDHIQLELDRSPRYPYTVQRWNAEGSQKLFSDTYRLDEALPDEDSEQMFVVRGDGERFEVDIEVTLIRRERRPEEAGDGEEASQAAAE